MPKAALSLLIAAVALACVGCSEDTDSSEAAAEEDAAKGAIEQAYEAQKKPMEKAAALEQQLQDAHERTKEEIDKQTEDEDDG